MRLSAAVLCLLVSSVSVDAFVPNARIAASRKHFAIFTKESKTTEKDTKTTEKQLREEIAERNSKVENEEIYAVKDGSLATEVAEKKQDTESDLYSTKEREALEKKLKKLVKTRPYALFLAEKAAELVEGIVDDFTKGSETRYPSSGKKEKVVVLGTGWGAASFLKDIDTDIYDVTVISPRNYFVFTPMLAGASVGTVEYRSITEPIREVRISCVFR